FFLLHPISPFPELLHGWLPLSPAAPRRRASPCSLHLPSPPRPSRLSRRRAPPLTPRNHRAAQAPRAPPAPLAGPLRLPCSSATTSPARSASLFPVAELAPHPRLCSGRLAARLPSLPAQLRRRARSVSPSPCCRAPPVHRAARAPCSAPPPRELRRQHPPAALPTSLLCLQRAAAARRVGLAQPGPGPSKPGTPKPKPDPSPVCVLLFVAAACYCVAAAPRRAALLLHFVDAHEKPHRLGDEAARLHRLRVQLLPLRRLLRLHRDAARVQEVPAE
ncbi:hypothetical protein BRADI_3g22342v3, partial [Brachypodium distachyon]